MTVMVTGVGFIGCYVVKTLLDRGESVIMYGHLGTSHGSLDTMKSPDWQFVKKLYGATRGKPKLGAVVGDINDYDLLNRTIKDHKVTKVVHLASLVSHASEADVPRALRVNVEGSTNVFQAALENDIKRVVWASSINVFGPRSFIGRSSIDDDSPVDPSSVYGYTKAFLEGLAASYHRNYGLNVVGLRPARVYGYGEELKATRGGGTQFVENLLRKPAIGAKSNVVPFGDMYMDFQYVEDMAAAFVQALNSQAGSGETFVTSGDRRLISDAFLYVKSLLPEADIRLAIEADGFKLPAGAQFSWSYPFDASRAENVLGIKATHSMEEGFLRTIAAYKDHQTSPALHR